MLFCDMAGSLRCRSHETRDAVRELLSRLFEIGRTFVGQYGGAVGKFIGDAVMAVWGTRAATEGDAERAVRAALDLVAAVGELGDSRACRVWRRGPGS